MPPRNPEKLWSSEKKASDREQKLFIAGMGHLNDHFDFGGCCICRAMIQSNVGVQGLQLTFVVDVCMICIIHI